MSRIVVLACLATLMPAPVNAHQMILEAHNVPRVCINPEQLDPRVLSGSPYIAVINETGKTIEKISCPPGFWSSGEYNVAGLGADSSYGNPNEIPPCKIAIVNFSEGGKHCDAKVLIRFKYQGGKPTEVTGNGSNIKESTLIVVSE